MNRTSRGYRFMCYLKREEFINARRCVLIDLQQEGRIPFGRNNQNKSNKVAILLKANFSDDYLLAGKRLAQGLYVVGVDGCMVIAFSRGGKGWMPEQHAAFRFSF